MRNSIQTRSNRCRVGLYRGGAAGNKLLPSSPPPLPTFPLKPPPRPFQQPFTTSPHPLAYLCGSSSGSSSKRDCVRGAYASQLAISYETKPKRKTQNAKQVNISRMHEQRYTHSHPSRPRALYPDLATHLPIIQQRSRARGNFRHLERRICFRVAIPGIRSRARSTHQHSRSKAQVRPSHRRTGVSIRASLVA